MRKRWRTRQDLLDRCRRDVEAWHGVSTDETSIIQDPSNGERFLVAVDEDGRPVRLIGSAPIEPVAGFPDPPITSPEKDVAWLRAELARRAADESSWWGRQSDREHRTWFYVGACVLLLLVVLVWLEREREAAYKEGAKDGAAYQLLTDAPYDACVARQRRTLPERLKDDDSTQRGIAWLCAREVEKSLGEPPWLRGRSWSPTLTEQTGDPKQ